MSAGITLDQIVGLYPEDSAHASGDFGMQILAVRNDVAGALAGADGDYSPLQVDASGNLRVVGSFTNNAEYAEDSAHTTGDVGMFQLAVRSDVKASTAGATGDYAAFIQDADGDLYVTDTVAQGLLTTIDADTSTIAGAVAGTEMQVDVVAALPAGDNNIGNVDIASALPAGTNNIGDVDIASSNTDVVEDAASVGGESMTLIGGVRQDANTSPVSADGDYHSLIFNDLGELKVSSRLDDVSSSLAVTTTSVDTTVGGVQLSAPLANRREITIQNLGSSDIWVKNGTGVTAGSGGNGFLIPKNSSATYKWSAAVDPYAITAGGTSSVKVIESAQA